MRRIFTFVLAFAVFILALSSCEFVGNDTHEHTFGDPSCTEPQKCSCGETLGEPLGHKFTSPTCTAASTCEYCGISDGEPLPHDLTEPTCISPSFCRNDGCRYTEGTLGSHVLSYNVTDGAVVYSCSVCGTAMTMDDVHYLDGTDHEYIVGVANRDNCYTHNGTHLPVLNENGYFELFNKVGKDAQLQLWIPSNTAEEGYLSGFTSGGGAVGFLSFDINAFYDTNFGIKFVDTSAEGARWSREWCITDPFMTLSKIYSLDGELTVTVSGWDDLTLIHAPVTPEDRFTGWINFIIGIELDADSDEIILHYYANGEYVGSASRPLTTSTGGINSIYVNGTTSALGSGIMLDNVAIGYKSDAEWLFD